MDDIDPLALQVAQEIASEMAGRPPQPLDPEEAEARTQYWAEVREQEAFERQLLEWERQRELEERQRLEAEAEAVAQRARALEQQREIADRVRQRQTAQAAEMAAQHAAHARASLARQEWATRQREALGAQRRQFLALGPMGHPPAKPDPVLQRLDEIAEMLEPPEPTLYERCTDPRLFKFPWQP